MPPVLLEKPQLQATLADLPFWKLSPDGKAITRQLEFKGFKQAFAFMTTIAAEATRLKHHPEWSNVYNKVDIRLTTHDADGITQLDIDLAVAVEKAAEAH